MYTDTQTGDEKDLVHIPMFASAEPTGEAEALKKFVWRDAKKEEVDSIGKNVTWKLVDLPTRKKSVEGSATKEAWGVTGEPRHSGEHHGSQPQHSFNRTWRRKRAPNWHPYT